MSLFVMADLHLPLSVNKPMDIFGGWDNYVEKIKSNWQSIVKPEDTVVIPGDLSWSMGLEKSYNDMKFIDELNGKKIIIKGNHDYWWNTVSKMKRFFEESGFTTLNILNNNHYQYENFGITGTRGWINDTGIEADKKVLLREAGRLDASISSAEKAGLKPIVFLHYPPIFGVSFNKEILDVLHRHDIEWCFYGHLHGRAHRNALNDKIDGINYRLISSDFLKFTPANVLKIVQNNNS